MNKKVVKMNENWCALCVAILKNVTPEQAFDCLDGKLKNTNFNHGITEQDILDMIELKKNYTYAEIGEMYGISENAVFKRMKRYLEPKETKKQKVTKEKAPIKKCEQRTICNDTVLAEMVALKDSGLSTKEIASRYGIDEDATRLKIYRYRKKLNKAV
jgi:DNA-binding CsgD family transcriptional regulator